MPRVYNFGAGPATLPLEVLEQVQKEFLNIADTGMSIVEMSHRNVVYDRINSEAQADIKELLGIGDEWTVMFMGGGASTQFAMVPMNFLAPGQVAAYVDTSTFSNKAYQDACKLGAAELIFTSKPEHYNRVPEVSSLQLPVNAAYLHITGNNTIEGTEYTEYPDTGSVPLIADMSSDILSKPLPMDRFSMIYAGAQKNIGPAGVVVVIAKRSFIAGRSKDIPTMLSYETHMRDDSLYNTPPAFAVYIVGLVAKWLKKQGGLTVMAERNEAKAKLLYDVMDAHPEFYRGHAEVTSRSLMNVTFSLPTVELEEQFVAEAKAMGLVSLKGHRSAGGIRASIYNAMPLEGCQLLATFMKKFVEKNGEDK